MNQHQPIHAPAEATGDLVALRRQEEHQALINGAREARYRSHEYMRLARRFPTDAGRFKAEAARQRNRARGYLQDARWKVT